MERPKCGVNWGELLTPDCPARYPKATAEESDHLSVQMEPPEGGSATLTSQVLLVLPQKRGSDGQHQQSAGHPKGRKPLEMNHL